MSIPGYIDLQVNGYLGIDFSSPNLTIDEFRFASSKLIESGTVVFLPTLITGPFEVYRRNIEVMKKAIELENWQKNIPGVHLEGPFISRETGAVGCHPKEFVRTPNFELIQEFSDFIKMMTIAAEYHEAEDFIKIATSHGIVISLGHQLAKTSDLERCAKAGAKTLTHLGNGIPNLIDRHHNSIWSGLYCDDLTAMIITDGHHLPKEVIKCMIRSKGVERIIVTSDASPGAGLTSGEYSIWGNHAILTTDGKLYNPEKNCLVGSASNMSQCMSYLESLELLDEKELQQVGYYNAAKLLKLL